MLKHGKFMYYNTNQAIIHLPNLERFPNDWGFLAWLTIDAPLAQSRWERS